MVIYRLQPQEFDLMLFAVLLPEVVPGPPGGVQAGARGHEAPQEDGLPHQVRHHRPPDQQADREKPPPAGSTEGSHGPVGGVQVPGRWSAGLLKPFLFF